MYEGGRVKMGFMGTQKSVTFVRFIPKRVFDKVLLHFVIISLYDFVRFYLKRVFGKGVTSVHVSLCSP